MHRLWLCNTTALTAVGGWPNQVVQHQWQGIQKHSLPQLLCGTKAPLAMLSSAIMACIQNTHHVLTQWVLRVPCTRLTCEVPGSTQHCRSQLLEKIHRTTDCSDGQAFRQASYQAYESFLQGLQILLQQISLHALCIHASRANSEQKLAVSVWMHVHV